MDDFDDFIERVVHRIRTTPPRCLAALKPTMTSFKEEYGYFLEWTLACQCGCSRGKVLGAWTNFSKNSDPAFNCFYAPHAFVCASCDKTTEFFDVKHHGYDAEIMPDQTNPFRGTAPAGPREAFTCRKCRANEGAVIACSTHSHFEHLEDNPEWEPRAQDFFDGFAIKLVCASCSAESWVSEYELA